MSVEPVRGHVHPKCLARWQLQSAGTRRETRCEFCDGSLPNWKEELTPITQLEAPAIMNVNFDGLSYSFEVQPGPEGYVAFTKAIRAAFNLPGDADLNITFTCDEPTSENGGLVTLQGPGAYDAAVHCASISAARRLANGQGWRADNISVWSGGAAPLGLEAAPRRRRMQGLSRRMRMAFQEVFQAARVLR
ncbi:hypothetical protein QBZ16_002280 [Prototheca wickerhamii]|uniref:Uncharacterized protein n=1 Tax=Prototheca wickerhamii TaxID=3111 RepID=A0AAD9IM82_PROWI|nr:hypothetical protein QBZ16_002280 [Prototheca wickerhamii]